LPLEGLANSPAEWRTGLVVDYQVNGKFVGKVLEQNAAKEP
jgi:hypothetical protein